MVRMTRVWPAPVPRVGSTEVPLSERLDAFRAALGFGALPGRSRPALDGHDDTAAEAQFGTDELSVLQEALTHNGQGRPKPLIVMAAKIHVVHDEDAAMAKGGHSPAQLEDLPTGRIREYQVKLAQAADDLRPIT